MKKLIYILIGIILCTWVGYRINVIYTESQREVFNTARMQAVPVETMIARSESGVLKEPLYIKNNRAYVSGARVRKFGVGQRVGGGHIISVASKLDLDTGMHLIRTIDVADGEQFAEQKYTGFFIPIAAVHNDKVMVAEDGIATTRDVKIINQDSENVLISTGLNDGDIIVLSKVENKYQIVDTRY
jgi:hypothetical protein